MSPFREILGNRAINNLATAVIVGFATVSFVGAVVGMIANELFDNGQGWDSSAFFSSLLVFVVLLATAVWMNRQTRG